MRQEATDNSTANNLSSSSWSNPENIHRILKLVMIIIPLALAGNIAYVLINANPHLIQDLGDFDIRFFLMAATITLLPWLGQTLGIMVWGRVFKAPVTANGAFNSVLASDIGAAIAPTLLGGSYAKLGLLVKYGFSVPQATMVTILGGLVDAVFFAIALPIAIFRTRTWENPQIIRIWHGFLSHWPVVIIIGIALIAILIFLKITGIKRATGQNSNNENGFPTRLLHRISRFRQDLSYTARFVLHNGKGAFLVCVLLSGLGWCGRYGAISALVAGLGYPVDPVLFFLLQWLVFTTMTMVPTPGAIGGAEVSFAIAYSGLIPAQAIPVVTTAWRFVTFYMTTGLASLIFALSRIGMATKGKEQSSLVIAEKSKAL